MLSAAVKPPRKGKTMARWYNMFHSVDERKQWEQEMKLKDIKFRVCMRMTAKQLKKDLPFVDIADYKYATIWTNE